MNEPIGLIILITSWLTINIATFPLGQMNIITVAVAVARLDNAPMVASAIWSSLWLTAAFAEW
jgi:hypothetical protein